MKDHCRVKVNELPLDNQLLLRTLLRPRGGKCEKQPDRKNSPIRTHCRNNSKNGKDSGQRRDSEERKRNEKICHRSKELLELSLLHASQEGARKIGLECLGIKSKRFHLRQKPYSPTSPSSCFPTLSIKLDAQEVSIMKEFCDVFFVFDF